MTHVLRRPETRCTRALHPWDLVWNDRRGWGVVLGAEGSQGPYSLGLPLAFAGGDEMEDRPAPASHRAHGPDPDRLEVRGLGRGPAGCLRAHP